MTAHPFDRILTPGANRPGDDPQSSSRPFQVKLDRRQALALLAASGAAIAHAPRSLWADDAPAGEGTLPTYKGRGLYLVQSRFRELWRASSREAANVLGPYVRGAEGADPAKPVVPDGAPPPPPVADVDAKDDPAAESKGAAGFLAWLSEEEAEIVAKERVVSGVIAYVPALKPAAPLDPAARKAALVTLAPNHWDRRPAADTFATDDGIAEELKASLAAVAGEVVVDVRDEALVLRRKTGEPFDDASLRIVLAHPQVASIEWDAVATTLALGEEGGELPPRATTEALGEEAGLPDATTFALGEEGTGPTTTYALGEEGGNVTTFALGEEGATTYALGEEGNATTFALGEEGSGGVTTYALGEEGSGGHPTTLALGEEAGGNPTTFALGEEGGGGNPTTRALGEEGGGIPNKPPASTRALGEEGGTVRPIPRPDFPPRPPVRPNPARPNPPRTTMALGEEGG